jgi:hypothetical protein
MAIVEIYKAAQLFVARGDVHMAIPVKIGDGHGTCRRSRRTPRRFATKAAFAIV